MIVAFEADLPAEFHEFDKWDMRGLRIAREVGSWSKDPSSQVGCYIADQRHLPISFGFNGFPAGIADDERLHDREVKYAIIIHAEVNALLNAARSVEGGTIYTYPFMPCSQCASFLIQSRVGRVVAAAHPNPRFTENFERARALLNEAGIPIVLIGTLPA